MVHAIQYRDTYLYTLWYTMIKNQFSSLNCAICSIKYLKYDFINIQTSLFHSFLPIYATFLTPNPMPALCHLPNF